MSKVIGIKIPYLKQIQYVYTDEKLEPGTKVIIDTSGGKFLCEVATKLETKNMMHSVYKNSKFVRVATPTDELQNLKALNENTTLCNIFEKGIKALSLPITLIGVWQSIDNKYIKIMYYSLEKINFKDIIGYVLKRYNRRIRIELVQVGTREYNALMGGYGVCGYELCCHNRNYTVPAITSETLRYIGYRIDIKDQLIGACSKYKCCLLYEANEYKRLMRNLPNYNEKIDYQNGVYTVVDINIFSKKVILVSKQERIEVDFSYFTSKGEKNDSRA